MKVRMFITEQPTQSQSKMKPSVLFLAILGVSAAAALPAGEILDLSTRDLKSDLDDFVALVPVEKITGIVLQYLAKDKEVQALAKYVKSKEFVQLVRDVEAIPEYIELLNILEKGGLPVYDAVNKLHAILGLPNLVPHHRTISPLVSTRANGGVKGVVTDIKNCIWVDLHACLNLIPHHHKSMSDLVSTRITGGVKGMIADIKACLDLKAIRALYDHKLKTSKDFAALVALIASDKYQAAVAKVKANPEYKALRAKALAAGLDVEGLSDLLMTLLGLKHSVSKRSSTVTRDLSSDLDDFAALVPIDKISGLIIQYLAEDKEVQAVAKYVKSNEFIQLVRDVEALPEYIEILNFLENGGLPVYDAVNVLHSILGLPDLVPSTRTSGGVVGLVSDIKNCIYVDLHACLNLIPHHHKNKSISPLVSTRITGGVKGLIADIEACLDLKAIRALYDQKLETSKEFASLVALIASDKVQAAVAQVKAHPQYVTLRVKALAAGLDVEAVSKLLLTLLGLA